MATVRVMISLPQDVLAEIDRCAEEEHRSRSEFLREAAQFYIQARQAQRRPIDDPRVRQAVEVMDRIAQRSPGTGEDSTKFIRQWRLSR